jgi:hypothetical protein
MPTFIKGGCGVVHFQCALLLKRRVREDFTFCAYHLAALCAWDTTDIFDILRLWRDNSTNKYYCTMFVIFESHYD